MKASSVTFSLQLDLLACVIAMNVVLSILHYVLFCLRERYKWSWPSKVLIGVDFLLSMLGLFMASRMPPKSVMLEDPAKIAQAAKEEIKK